MKKTYGILSLLFAACFSWVAYAYVVPTYRDLKPATQVMIEHQRITTPILADNDRVKTTYAGPTSAAAVVLTSFTAQPDVPRNLTITPTGTTTDVEACTITAAGTDILDDAITEDFAFAANDAITLSGAKAFKTVSSVTWPASCESGSFGATWIIGVGDVLGLKSCMDYAGAVAWAVFDGAYEGTRPTCVADNDEVSKNTCDINGTLNGSKSVDLFYVQNFRCK